MMLRSFAIATTILLASFTGFPNAAAAGIAVVPSQPWKTQPPASPQAGRSLIRVTPSHQLTETGERILNVELMFQGRPLNHLQAVSGKADVQHFRRGPESQAGSREPLPQGTYRIGAVDQGPGLPAAMGSLFIPLTPQFATHRNGLGIHQDADRHQGGAGTIGCLGLLNPQDIHTVATFVTQYQVQTLVVDYGLQ